MNTPMSTPHSRAASASDTTTLHTETGDHADEVADIIAASHETGTPLRIVGGGTWLDAGRHVSAAKRLSVSRLAGVVEYVPSDLVITVQAGTTLNDIAAATAEYGQWLALDPMGESAGTIGATVATGSSGPLALGSGTVRDLVLGLRSITGTGARIAVGGRVVKNVAGFDLVRLAIGACGTLGVITEVSIRLHARPAADLSFALSDEDAAPLLALVERLGLRALTLQAMELLNPALASAVGVGAGNTWVLLARATGNASAVAAQRHTLATLHPVADVSPAVWRALREADADASILRISASPSESAVTLGSVRRALDTEQLSTSMLRVTPHRGVIRVAIPRDHALAHQQLQQHQHQHIAALVAALRETTHRVIGERLPDLGWRALPATASDALSQRLRETFDPRRILNGDILGQGIA